MQMLEHPLAMRDLPRAEAAGAGAVQARRVRFEAHPVERGLVVVAPGPRPAQHEANEHEHDTNRTA